MSAPDARSGLQDCCCPALTPEVEEAAFAAFDNWSAHPHGPDRRGRLRAALRAALAAAVPAGPEEREDEMAEWIVLETTDSNWADLSDRQKNKFRHCVRLIRAPAPGGPEERIRDAALEEAAKICEERSQKIRQRAKERPTAYDGHGVMVADWIQGDADSIRFVAGSVSSGPAEPVAYLWQHNETGRKVIRMAEGEAWSSDGKWSLVGPLVLRGSVPGGSPTREEA